MFASPASGFSSVKVEKIISFKAKFNFLFKLVIRFRKHPSTSSHTDISAFHFLFCSLLVYPIQIGLLVSIYHIYIDVYFVTWLL